MIDFYQCPRCGSWLTYKLRYGQGGLFKEWRCSCGFNCEPLIQITNKTQLYNKFSKSRATKK